MKIIFFTSLFLVIVSMPLISQNSLGRDLIMPRANDTIIKQCVEYREPGRMGENVLWDFCKLKTIDESYILAYGQEGDSLTGTEHNTTYYYGVKGDSLLLYGYEKPTTWMKYVRPELLLKFPIRYGDSINSYFQGLGRYCNDLSLLIMGKSTVKVDAYGMMVLPNGDTLKHVLRTSTTRYMAEASGELNLRVFKKKLLDAPLPTDSINYHLISDSVMLKVETFCWYEEGYRYPIFETVRGETIKHGSSTNFFSLSFYYPPQEQYYALENDSENQKRRDEVQNEEDKKRWNADKPSSKASQEKNDQLSYVVEVSPEGLLKLNYQLYEDALVAVMLYDLQGRQLSKEESYRSVGGYTNTIPLSSYATNDYLLRIRVNNQTYGIKITSIKH